MAGGGIVAGHGVDLHAEQYHGKLTVYVVFVALMAASGGLLFGYDLGVTGGVESMVRCFIFFVLYKIDMDYQLEESLNAGKLPTKVFP